MNTNMGIKWVITGGNNATVEQKGVERGCYESEIQPMHSECDSARRPQWQELEISSFYPVFVDVKREELNST